MPKKWPTESWLSCQKPLVMLIVIPEKKLLRALKLTGLRNLKKWIMKQMIQEQHGTIEPGNRTLKKSLPEWHGVPSKMCFLKIPLSLQTLGIPVPLELPTQALNKAVNTLHLACLAHAVTGFPPSWEPKSPNLMFQLSDLPVTVHLVSP